MIGYTYTCFSLSKVARKCCCTLNVNFFHFISVVAAVSAIPTSKCKELVEMTDLCLLLCGEFCQPMSIDGST